MNGPAEDGASDEVPAQSAQAAPDVPAAEGERREQTLLDWLGHELRNPIATIELAVHAMRELGDERLDLPLAILERQSGQLSRVVLELLEMARAMSAPPSGIPAPHPVALEPDERFVARERMASSSDATRAAARAGKSLPRRRLLLVEDNEDLAGLLCEMLTAWGFEVEVAGTATSALAKAAVRPPDLALIDIGLPDRDGCDVARALRSSLPEDVRLLAMSGYGQRQDGARALAAGFDEYLVKPLNTARLRRLLGEMATVSAMSGGEH